MDRPLRPGNNMTTTIKLKGAIIERLDLKQSELALDTRTNLVEVLLRKGLDYLDNFGYDGLLKIPSGLNNDVKQDDRSGLRRKIIDEIVVRAK